MHIRPTDGRRWAASFIVLFMRVILAGGGTGGHVIPAIAIAQELQKRYGAEVLFIGTARGLENRLVPAAGFAAGCRMVYWTAAKHKTNVLAVRAIGRETAFKIVGGAAF